MCVFVLCVCVCVYLFIQCDEKRNFSINKERVVWMACLERGYLASQNNFKRLLEGSDAVERAWLELNLGLLLHVEESSP